MHPHPKAVNIVENFWREVWMAKNPEAVDQLVAEDFVITSGGVDICSRAAFKRWIAAFLEKIDDFQFQVIETFQNPEGTRVASRWKVTGRNNGFAGTSPCKSPIELVGTAVWEIRPDGLLQHNWVDRNSFEVYQQLCSPNH
jgi:hypothetical protein